MTPISVQTDPDEPVVLIGADATTQTEEEVKSEPVVVVEEKPIEMEEEHEQRQTDSDESEPDLSPEELRNLLDELNRSTRTAKEPSPVKTPPPPPQRSEQSMFLAKLAPSYGAHVLAGAGDRSLLKQADESICGALAKKYGIQASAASTPLRQHHQPQQHHNESHTMSGKFINKSKNEYSKNQTTNLKATYQLPPQITCTDMDSRMAAAKRNNTSSRRKRRRKLSTMPSWRKLKSTLSSPNLISSTTSHSEKTTHTDQ